MNSNEVIESATDSTGSLSVEPLVEQLGCEHSDAAQEVIGEGHQDGAPYYLVRCICGAEEVKEGTP